MRNHGKRPSAAVGRERGSLSIRGGPNDGTMMPLPGRAVIVGRGPDNDLVVDEETVSRRHAAIIPVAAGFVVRDLASANGTYVNSEEVGGSERILRHGDSVRFATSETVLVFRREPSGQSVDERSRRSGWRAEREHREVEENEDQLTDTESALLRLLRFSTPTAVSREEIARRVWPEVALETVSSRQLIDRTVFRIRSYLGDDHRGPRRLITVGEYGFLLI